MSSVEANESRRLERRLPVRGLERCPGCHPERSEGSGEPAEEILRCAQDDNPYLHMSTSLVEVLTFILEYAIYLCMNINLDNNLISLGEALTHFNATTSGEGG